MPIVTIIPTSNTTPDPGQGGIAVTGNSNTGHAATNVASLGSDGFPPVLKTCVWTAFGAGPAGIRTSVKLRITWSENGSVLGNADTRFTLQYSTNGGGAWNTILQHLDVSGPNSATSEITLPVLQDLTQVRVRDELFASTIAGGDEATLTVTVSDIQIEVVTVIPSVVAIF